MNRRNAASSWSGLLRWCMLTNTRSRWFLIVFSWLTATGVAHLPTGASEPAPMPPGRHADPLQVQFRPRMADAPVNMGLSAGEIGRSETAVGDSAIHGMGPDGVALGAPVPENTPSGASSFFGAPQERFAGPGQPLIQESWDFRPFSVTGVFGFVQGSTLIDDWIRGNQGVFGGFQLGWDCENYWGFETRFAWAEVEVIDSDRAIAAQIANDDAAGLAPNDPFRHRFDGRRHNHVFFWDAHALYYPWGDSAWRPYLMAGMGATHMSFMDRTDVRYRDNLFTVPVGAGVKYRLGDFLAVRVEAADFMAFGGGHTLELIHNVTVIGALELRLGGARRAYWPWNPGRHYW